LIRSTENAKEGFISKKRGHFLTFKTVPLSIFRLRKLLEEVYESDISELRVQIEYDSRDFVSGARLFETRDAKKNRNM